MLMIRLSGYGEKLDVVAPGGQLLGTVPWYEGNVYPNASGTSFACPHVSGLAALMLTVNPLLNVEQLQETIDSTCVKLNGYGYGITYPYGSWNSKIQGAGEQAQNRRRFWREADPCGGDLSGLCHLDHGKAGEDDLHPGRVSDRFHAPSRDGSYGKSGSE